MNNIGLIGLRITLTHLKSILENKNNITDKEDVMYYNICKILKEIEKRKGKYKKCI